MDTKKNKDTKKEEIIIKKEGLIKINELMNKAVDFYEQTLYRTVDKSVIP